MGIIRIFRSIKEPKANCCNINHPCFCLIFWAFSLSEFNFCVFFFYHRDKEIQKRPYLHEDSPSHPSNTPCIFY